MALPPDAVRVKRGLPPDAVRVNGGLPPDAVRINRPQPSMGPFQTAGEVLAGGFKRAFQAGPTSFNTITGGIGTELAHGVKTEALERGGVDPIVAEALSGATDAQALAPAAISRVASRFRNTPGALQRYEAMKTSAKGRATVSRLLPSAKIYEDAAQGRPSGVQAEGFNVIKKGGPQRILDIFRNERDKVMALVDDLVEKNNKPVEPRAIRERAAQILSNNLKNAHPDEIVAFREAMDAEDLFLPSDTVKANARKRYLYQKTAKLQEAAKKGQPTVTRPETQLVEDAYAQAYREAIEEVIPEVSAPNKRFSGLNEGTNATAKLLESELEQTPPGEKVASQTLGRPSVWSGIAALIRELPVVGSSPKRLSGLIEKLRIKHGEQLLESRKLQAPRLIGKEFFKASPEPPPGPSPAEQMYKGPSGGVVSAGPDVIELAQRVLEKPYGEVGGFRTGPKTPGAWQPTPEGKPYGEHLPYKPPTKLKDLARKSKNRAKNR